jgi:hypothetical protein
MNDDDRQLPQPREDLLTNEYRNGKTRHQSLPKQPARAVAAKAAEMRSTMLRHGPIDWSDLHARYVDLWHEARLALWRAKHSKAGIKKWNEEEQRDELTFVVDEKQVLACIDTTRGVLDSIVRLRDRIGPDAVGIPHWAIVRIERALRDHPKALHALLQELATERDTDHDDDDDDD